MPVLVKKSWSQDALVLKMFADNGLIRKSGRTWHFGADREMGYGPKELFDSIHDHPHHDESGLGVHQPAFGFNPATGELEDALHPVDAIMKNLGELCASKGWGARNEQDARHMAGFPRALLSNSIDTHNDQLPEGTKQKVPGVDSSLHRRNFIVPPPEKGSGALPYEHIVMAKDRIHEETGQPYPQRFGTYTTSKSHIDHPSTSKGEKVDAGYVPYHSSLKALFINENKKRAAKGYRTFSDKEINAIPYLNSPFLPPHLMNPNVKNLSRHQAKHLFEHGIHTPELRGEEGQYDNLSDDEKGKTTSLLGAFGAGIPRAYTAMKETFTDRARSEGGGRKGKTARAFEEAGLDLSEEEMDMFLRMRLSSLLYGKVDNQKGVGTIPNKLMSEFGIHPNHPDYKEQLDNLMGAGNVGGAFGGQSEHSRKLVALARAVGHDKFREAEYMPPGHEWNEEGQAVADKVVTHMMGHHGIDAHDYEAELSPKRPSPHIGQTGHEYERPDHYHPHMAGVGDMAPATEWQAEQQRKIEEEAPAPAPAPPVPPIGPPMAPPPMQRLTAPAPMLPPTGIGGPPMAPPPQLPPRMSLNESMTLLRSRDDIVNAMSDIQKAMEEIQLSQAVNDGEVKKHVKPLVDLYSTETALFAKNLGLTSNDVRGIGATKGDWGRIAKQWNVSELTVKVIKTSIGGV